MGAFEELLGVNFFNALFTLANTLAIFFVAKKFLYKPVMKIIKDRQQEIDDMYSQADTSREQATALQAEYEKKLSEAGDKADLLVKEAVARGQRREEEILRQANAEANAIREKASADIAQEKKKAINEAKDEISVIAVTIAGKVVGRELNDADQSALVDSFIDQLGDQV